MGLTNFTSIPMTITAIGAIPTTIIAIGYSSNKGLIYNRIISSHFIL